MLNHIVLMGRLTRDPELRHTQSGLPVVGFTLAVDRDFSREGSEKQTDFIDVTAWRGTAEFVAKWFQKGRMAVVSGRLQTRKYTDRDGNNRTAFEVVADNVYFGEGKRDGDSGPRYSAPSGAYTAPVSGSDFEESDDDGDLPF